MRERLKQAKKPVFHVGLVFFVLSYGMLIHRCNSEATHFEDRAKKQMQAHQKAVNTQGTKTATTDPK